MARRAVLLSAAIALAASPALAASVTTPATLPELFEAAKAVCFDHIGDHEAQRAAAGSAPYGAVQERIDDDGTVVMSSKQFTFSMLDDGRRNYCMVSAVAKGKVNSEKGVAAAEKLLGKPVSSDGTTAMWFGRTSDDQPVMYGFMAMDGDGFTLASYASGTETQ